MAMAMAMAMAISFLFLTICLIFPSFIASTRTLQDPELVVQQVHSKLNDSRRKLEYLSCGTGNPIDDCWRCDPDWDKNRQWLAVCGTGFGKDALGGKGGKIYVVTDSSDDDPVTPKQGTIRYAVIQDEPLWIIFAGDMVIELKEELIMNSFKTIDGRGAKVEITGNSGITVQYVDHIIIHNIEVRDMKSAGNAMVRSTPNHFGWRTKSDGDGISIFGANHVWVDHCELSNCADGLIDAIEGSTSITISNNYMHDHDKVMLLGASDSYAPDDNMQVTVAFNCFGINLGQRMPRGRRGYFHVVNNYYKYGWEIYAIGGTEEPTFNCQGNKFVAPNDNIKKEVTFHDGVSKEEWKKWNWRSDGDLMVNGAFFTPSGDSSKHAYAKASSLNAKSWSQVDTMTWDSGVLKCQEGSQC